MSEELGDSPKALHIRRRLAVRRNGVRIRAERRSECNSVILTCISAFGATAYTVDLDLIVADFGFDKKKNPNYLPIGPISGFSLYLFGIFFAPIWTPHVTERIGRSIFYLTSLPLCGAFLLGAGFVKSFAGLAVLRFLAGFSGGPCLVLIEGTFADIWSAKTTNTYYAFQGTAQFFGTALGPLIGGLLVQATNNWRWTQWFSAVLCGIVALLGLGLSESYQREIPRRRAKRRGRVLQQGPPLSGSTFSEIFRITVMDPMIQVFTDPVVMLSTVILTFNFAVVLQFFITVPVALGTKPPNGAGFTLVQIGEAFTSAIVGSTGAALVVILLDQITTGMLSRKGTPTFATIEYRLLPAMIGPILVTAALFWIGKSSQYISSTIDESLTNRRHHRRQPDIPARGPNHRHCRLRLGRRNGHILCHTLSVRRLPSPRNSFSPHSRSHDSPALRRDLTTCHPAFLHSSHAKVGSLHIRLHLHPYVGDPIRVIPLWTHA